MALLTGVYRSCSSRYLPPGCGGPSIHFYVISQTVPILALAPLLIIWFGFGIARPKVIVVTLFCFFPIAINTSDGLTSTEPELIDLFRSMWGNVASDLDKGPGCQPLHQYFYSGLKIAATSQRSWRGRRGQWVGAKQGLGIFMLRSSAAFQTAQVFSAIVITFAPEHSPVPDGLCDRARDDALVPLRNVSGSN